MSDGEKGKHESPIPSIISRVNTASALLLALGAGTFVTMAGGAVTLFYFWSLGGVPYGQASSVGALTGVVLPTAFFLFCVFFGIWLAPSLMSWSGSKSNSDTSALNQLFVMPGASADEEPRLYVRRLVAFTGLTAVLPIAAPLLWLEVMPTKPEWGLLVLLVVLVVAGAIWVRWAIHKTGPATSVGQSSAKGCGRFSVWLLQFVFTGLCSVVPFGVLLLVASQTAITRGDDYSASFVINAAVIALMLCVALIVSYAVQLRRKVGQPVNWGALVGLNAGLLIALMFFLGVHGRTLDVVMVLSSVRAEGVNLTLSEEGCDILAAMNADGWQRSPLPNSKTCVLNNVILESALEPNIQVACKRPGVASNGGRSTAEHFTLPSKFVLSIWKHGNTPKTMEPVCPTSQGHAASATTVSTAMTAPVVSTADLSQTSAARP